jgi:hypothetical protein
LSTSCRYEWTLHCWSSAHLGSRYQRSMCSRLRSSLICDILGVFNFRFTQPFSFIVLRLSSSVFLFSGTRIIKNIAIVLVMTASDLFRM